MRRRERTYFLLLGTVSAFALLAGAWPVSLLMFAALELTWSGIEWIAARRLLIARRCELRLRRSPYDVAGGILRSAP